MTNVAQDLRKSIGEELKAILDYRQRLKGTPPMVKRTYRSIIKDEQEHAVRLQKRLKEL